MSQKHFQLKKENRISLKPVLSIGLFVVIILAFLLSFGSISEGTRKRQLESLENALARNVIHYYSLEGKYPDSLDILQEKYGLTYNKEFFYVDYRFMGDNIYPDITIIEEVR